MINFVRKNNQLLHLDLSHSHISEDQIKRLMPEIHKAISLQAVHLCGNPGRTPEVINWITVNLKCFASETINILKVHDKRDKPILSNKDLKYKDENAKQNLALIRETIT